MSDTEFVAAWEESRTARGAHEAISARMRGEGKVVPSFVTTVAKAGRLRRRGYAVTKKPTGRPPEGFGAEAEAIFPHAVR